jgi:hypothetical protein
MACSRARLIQLVALSIIAALFSTVARADDPIDSAVAHMGVGAGITFNRPTSSDGHSNEGLAFVYRWHGFHSGWGPSVGIDWHSNDFDHTFGSTTTMLGSMRTRAILGGYGYTKRLKRFSASASVGGGYSFNDFSVATGAGANAGVSLVGVGVDNSWVVRPDVGVWYDIFRHVGIGVSVAYLVNRPNETVTTVAGSQTQRLHADTWELTTGVTFGVWKKHT